MRNKLQKSPIPAAPGFVSPRVCLVDMGTVRAVRGVDAETVVKWVGNGTHPNFLRWVFNIGRKSDGIRSLRFWREEIFGTVDKWGEPALTIERILGQRQTFWRGELEIQWTASAVLIMNLIRAGEITEESSGISRQSLTDFLKRRLQ
jgi:hypothetical protein